MGRNGFETQQAKINPRTYTARGYHEPNGSGFANGIARIGETAANIGRGLNGGSCPIQLDSVTLPESSISTDFLRSAPVELLSDVQISNEVLDSPITQNTLSTESEKQSRESRLELSMLEPGSLSFARLVDRSFGVTRSGLMGVEYLQRMLSPDRERKGVREALDKPGEEVVLYRKAERERLAQLYPAAILDASFFSQMSERFEVPLASPERPGTTAEQFYLGNMKLANQAVRQFKSDLLPYSDGQTGMRNEVDPPQHFPSRIFHMLMSENTSDKLRYELQRQLVLWNVAAEITARQWNYRLTAKLNDLMQVLDEQMFAGETGEANEATIKVWHDKTTGRVNRIEDPDVTYKREPGNSLYKEHPLQMRGLLDLDELVRIDLNEKNLESAILKTLIVAKDDREKGKGDGELKPLDDATDMSRLLFAVKGGNTELNEVMERFKEVISDPSNYDLLSEVKAVKPDHRTNGRRGQSKSIKFKRYKVEFDDLPIDVEVMFYTLQNYLNSQLAVGKKGSNGEYDGGAHELYRRYRLMNVLRDIYPKGLYPDSLEDQALAHIDSVAATLLHQSLEDKSA